MSRYKSACREGPLSGGGHWVRLFDPEEIEVCESQQRREPARRLRASARAELLLGFSKESLDRAAEFGSMDGIG